VAPDSAYEGDDAEDSEGARLADRTIHQGLNREREDEYAEVARGANESQG